MLDCTRIVRKMDPGSRDEAPVKNNEKSVTGPVPSDLKPLKIGDIEVANRVLLAPMSGVTDMPFRRLAAALGAGIVVSEMTASNDLVNGRLMSRLRCEATGRRHRTINQERSQPSTMRLQTLPPLVCAACLHLLQYQQTCLHSPQCKQVRLVGDHLIQLRGDAVAGESDAGQRIGISIGVRGVHVDRVGQHGVMVDRVVLPVRRTDRGADRARQGPEEIGQTRSTGQPIIRHAGKRNRGHRHKETGHANSLHEPWPDHMIKRHIERKRGIPERDKRKHDKSKTKKYKIKSKHWAGSST